MFVNAIETATAFTRPIHSISRNYGSTDVHAGAATLFFINSDGWAMTCGHVARHIMATDAIGSKYQAYKAALVAQRGTRKEKQILRELEKKFGYSPAETIELHMLFVQCIEGNLELNIMLHEQLDVALIRFRNYSRLLCDKFPVFPADTSNLKQGKSLCRLGFPFAEFNNFAYDQQTDQIMWTDTGRRNTPTFPIEGMVTRYLVTPEGQLQGFEMSTPGLRGQSGGPAFDSDGKIWGMQAATGHLDLNFDVDQDVFRDGIKKKVKDSAFLHVGHCIHVDIMKDFMRKHNVAFQEA